MIRYYPEIELKYIPGHNPDLVLLADGDDGKVRLARAAPDSRSAGC